jgi:exodeoxyribonuclease VII small subunit
MSAKNTINFTKAYEELEKIVSEFETGDIDLERDLPKFERGLSLAKNCRDRLKEIENQVRKIEKAFHLQTEAPDEKTIA